MDSRKLAARMTLEEKTGLLSGGDSWHTKGVERLGVPAVMVSDGPYGLRKQDEHAAHTGANESIQAVCFPAGCLTACSFDRELMRLEGEALGDACLNQGVGVILGPGVNIKRSPLCGRNFEYFSEDPLLAGEMAAAWIQGVQSRGVGASVKHFAANNQEHRRMSSDSVMDERTLREIYLTPFEIAVKKGRPWTVMCSYNRLRGVYASENQWLLTDVLRKEWGFEGCVISDWGAVSDRVAGVKAGLDLEMPSSDGVNDRKAALAVEEGRLTEEQVELCAARVAELALKARSHAACQTPWDKDQQHRLSGQIAAESMVLLKNRDDILPLKPEQTAAFIGEFAVKPRYQGGGSSHIHSYAPDSALQAAEGLPVTYARGYDGAREEPDEALLAQAEEAARSAAAAVVFAGLPDRYECEGYDRRHMSLPACQNALIQRVAKANPNTVVVLHNGSPVEMPWIDDVAGVLEAYLGGEAAGTAVKRILYGEANPSGRLGESFPLRLEDNPSYLWYGGEGDRTEYREGIFVGYRYYDKLNMPLLFPFGYGLSYTSFDYSGLTLSSAVLSDREELRVAVEVENTGRRFGKEVVQLYVHQQESGLYAPERELREFLKVALEPGERKRVEFLLDKRAFAHWDIDSGDWRVESGVFEIQICRSSREVILSQPVTLRSTQRKRHQYHLNSIFMDVMADPKGAAVLSPMLEQLQRLFTPTEEEASQVAREAITDEMNAAMLRYMPLRAAVSFSGGAITQEMLTGLIDALNAHEEER